MKNLLAILIIAAFSFAVNYALALADEPRSLWLMKTLGVM